MQTAYMISLSMALVIFFLLGAFLGKISKESVLGYGLKMLFAGVVLALVLYLLSAAGVVSTSTA